MPQPTDLAPMAHEIEQHPFEWEGSPAVEQVAVLAPTGRRRPPWKLAAAGAAVAALAALALATLGGGSSGLPSTPVSLAADVTTATPGFKFAMTVAASLGGKSFATTASGEITEQPPSGSMQLSVAGATAKEIFVNPYIYIQLPSAGARWVKVDLATEEQSLGVSSIGGNDPSALLDFLRAAGRVSNVGQQQIGGVLTTHYHALADLERYASVVAPSMRPAASINAATFERLTGSTTIPIDAWVDAQNRVRQVTLSVSSACTKPGPLTETITMNFFDYGRQAAVSPPPDADTTDVTSQISSASSQSLSQVGC